MDDRRHRDNMQVDDLIREWMDEAAFYSVSEADADDLDLSLIDDGSEEDGSVRGQFTSVQERAAHYEHAVNALKNLIGRVRTDQCLKTIFTLKDSVEYIFDDRSSVKISERADNGKVLTVNSGVCSPVHWKSGVVGQKYMMRLVETFGEPDADDEKSASWVFVDKLSA